MNDRRLAAQSGLWSFVLQWSRFGLNTVVFLILARWLSLEEIGAFAIAYAPVGLIQLVQRAGFSGTIIQGPRGAGTFTDTVFWMSVTFGLVMSLLLLCASFFVGAIIESASLSTFLAAMSVIPALIGVAAVPEGLLTQRFEIRSLALRTTISITIAGGIAIWLGYFGYGGWALTAFSIANALISTVLVLALVSWAPRVRARVKDLREALPVLSALSGRSLVVNSEIPALQLIIGVGLGPAAAGTFQIAHRFMSLAATAAVTPLNFATLPVFVRVRDDAVRLRRTIVKTAGLASILSAPLYFGMLSVAPLLVPLAVGETNGNASVHVLQAMLLVGGTIGLFRIFTKALTAIGKAALALWWSIGLLLINVTVAGIGVQYSITMVALGYSLVGYVVAPVMLKLLHTHTGVVPTDIIKSVSGPVFAAIVMAISILLIGRTLAGSMSDLALLTLEVLAGIAIYLLLSLMVSRQQITTARDLLATVLPERS